MSIIRWRAMRWGNMFEGLNKRLTQVFDRLRGRGALTEEDVQEALREIRVALLEADVALPVVKDVMAQIREKAIGTEVLRSITPGQMVVKIVFDHLVQLLGGEVSPLTFSAAPPVIILMVGLQGSGKTTSSGKLARFLSQKEGKKVLLASTDIYRPAAQHQLEVLAQQVGVDALPIIEGQLPLAIAQRGYEAAKKGGYDFYIVDTAGRLHIDSELMEELTSIKKSLPVTETLLVADAMTGQDAVRIASAFHESLQISGIVLTRIDGDARGGAALSMRSVTQCPIKFVGAGEQLDKFELFHPDRIANRILGMGDVLSLVEKASEVIDQEDAEKLASRMKKGVFDLNDMMKQLQGVSKMGGLGGVMNMLPGMSRFQDKLQDSGVNDGMIRRQVALIQSMTPEERRTPKLLNASRKRRIAKGAGTDVAALNRLLKQYFEMSNLIKKIGGWEKKGGRSLANLKNLFTRH